MKKYYEQEDVWKKINVRTEKRLKATLQLIPKDIQSILDIGCGDGRFTNELDGFKSVIGLDISKTALKKIRHKKILGKCDMLPFHDNIFDLVIATELLEHLNNNIYNKTIKELQRVTKKYILISVPYKQKPYVTYVKCKNCGSEYSPISHQRYFNKHIVKNIFKNTKKKIQLIGTKRSTPIITPILKRIGQKIFGNYLEFENCICPQCESIEIEVGFNNKISELFSGFVWRFTIKSPDWIACLFEIDN